MAVVSVQQSGGDYTTLNGAFANATDGVDSILIEGSWTVDDTAAITAAITIEVTCDSSSKQSGVVDGTNRYRHRAASGHAITVTATKTIGFTDLDIQNESTGTSDEVCRVSNASPTLTFTRCFLGFASRTDQQDGVYSDSDDTTTTNLVQCVLYSIYRSAVDYFETGTTTVNFNSCTGFDLGFGTDSSGRSGAFGHAKNAGSDVATCNMHNCYFDLNAGYAISSDQATDVMNVTYSQTSGSQWINENSLDTDTGNTESIPAVDSAPSVAEAYFTDVTTHPYNFLPITEADNSIQDDHATATSLSLTIPSTDMIGVSRPDNTNFENGAFEIDTTAPAAGQPTMRRWGGIPGMGGLASWQ